MKNEMILEKIKEIKKAITENELFHELCLIFPFSENLVIDLVADIEKIGQVEPITKYAGKILDGRHRWIACKILGVMPKFIEIDHSVDPNAYARSKNLKRRDLNTFERISIALRLDNWSPPVDKDSQIIAIKEYYHNKRIAKIASSSATPVKKVKEIITIAENTPEIKKIIENPKNKSLPIDTLYRKAKNPTKSIKQIKRERGSKDKKKLKTLRKNLATYRFLYNYIKLRCNELGIWDRIWEIYTDKRKNNEPTMEDLRKAELI